MKKYSEIREVLADLDQPVNTPTIFIYDKSEDDIKVDGDFFWTRGVKLNPESWHPLPIYVIQFYRQVYDNVSIIKLGHFVGSEIHEEEKERRRIIVKKLKVIGYTEFCWMQFMQTKSRNSARIIY